MRHGSADLWLGGALPFPDGERVTDAARAVAFFLVDPDRLGSASPSPAADG